MGISMRYILCVISGVNGMDCPVINFVVHVGSSEKEGGFWVSSEQKVPHVSLMNPIHPNNSLYILHTVLHTISKMLTRRIC